MTTTKPRSEPLPANWAQQVLWSLGLEATAASVARLHRWQRREGGSTGNTASFNPLNTKIGYGNSVGFNSGKHKTGGEEIQAYGSWSEGLHATAYTLKQYPSLVEWLRTGKTTHNTTAAFSTFSGGDYAWLL